LEESSRGSKVRDEWRNNAGRFEGTGATSVGVAEPEVAST